MPELLVPFRRLALEHEFLVRVRIQIRQLLDVLLVQHEIYVGQHDDVLSLTPPLCLSLAFGCQSAPIVVFTRFGKSMYLIPLDELPRR